MDNLNELNSYAYLLTSKTMVFLFSVKNKYAQLTSAGLRQYLLLEN